MRAELVTISHTICPVQPPRYPFCTCTCMYICMYACETNQCKLPNIQIPPSFRASLKKLPYKTRHLSVVSTGPLPQRCVLHSRHCVARIFLVPPIHPSCQCPGETEICYTVRTITLITSRLWGGRGRGGGGSYRVRVLPLRAIRFGQQSIFIHILFCSAAYSDRLYIWHRG